MPRICTICRHPNRTEIDTALVRSESLRSIANRTGASASAILRHRNKCLPAHLLKAKQQTDLDSANNLAKEARAIQHAELESAVSLVKELREITRKTALILTRATREKNGDLALKAIARLERQLELKARLLGELEERAPGGVTRVEVCYVDKAVIMPAVPARALPAAVVNE